MNAVFYGIADAFDVLFGILPHVASFTNVLFMVGIFVGIVAWSNHLVKTKHEELGHNERY